MLHVVGTITVVFHIAEVQACVTPHARDARLHSK